VDRSTCLVRDADVVITSWSDARISWPRCRAIGRGGSGSGLLVDEELARAVRLESSIALQHWFGIRGETVWRWRQILRVPKLNPDSARLRRALNREYGGRLRGKRLPPDQVERRRQTARALGLRPTGRWAENGWTADQLALLGKVPDAELAAPTGRTVGAVRCQRTGRGIPSARDRRRRENR
jgi:hypothetical protein